MVETPQRTKSIAIIVPTNKYNHLPYIDYRIFRIRNNNNVLR